MLFSCIGLKLDSLPFCLIFQISDWTGAAFQDKKYTSKPQFLRSPVFLYFFLLSFYQFYTCGCVSFQASINHSLVLEVSMLTTMMKMRAPFIWWILQEFKSHHTKEVASCATSAICVDVVVVGVLRINSRCLARAWNQEKGLYCVLLVIFSHQVFRVVIATMLIVLASQYFLILQGTQGSAW